MLYNLQDILMYVPRPVLGPCRVPFALAANLKLIVEASVSLLREKMRIFTRRSLIIIIIVVS